MKVTVTKASDRRWMRWMKLGAKTGCHQIPDRSFYVRGYQFPVCARCTGAVLGYLIAIPVFIKHGLFRKTSITGCSIMLADWSLQRADIVKSTNLRRFISGIAGGFGIMSIQLAIIKGCIHKIKGCC